MQFLVETKLRKRRSGHGNLTRKARKRIIDNNVELYCEKCKCSLNKDTATLDHIVPNILILASLGGMKQSVNNFRVLCRTCNHHDDIPNWLGILFKSTDVDVIEQASRNLCNLVRGK